MKPGYLDSKESQVEAKPSKEDHAADEIQPHHVESAFNTLMEAEKIKKNQKLMPHVVKHAEAHGQALDTIKSLQAPKDGKPKSVKELRAIHEKNALAKRGM